MGLSEDFFELGGDSILLLKLCARARELGLTLTPRALFATMNGTLLAPIGGKEPGLEVLGSDQQPTTVELPAGQVAATYWGDLVAVAAGSNVVLYEPQGRKRRETIDTPIEARSVLFSPSGHRLYVAGAGSLYRVDMVARGFAGRAK